MERPHTIVLRFCTASARLSPTIDLTAAASVDSRAPKAPLYNTSPHFPNFHFSWCTLMNDAKSTTTLRDQGKQDGIVMGSCGCEVAIVDFLNQAEYVI